ncbi:MAG: hypothetical protein FH758_03885 [Firmicutes bacterium]|nr:hypothetical protein [Bacillota bacterium]
MSLTPYLLLATFGSKDFALFCKLVRLLLTSPRIRGPSARGLPPASHRYPCFKQRLVPPSTFVTFTYS